MGEYWLGLFLGCAGALIGIAVGGEVFFSTEDTPEVHEVQVLGVPGDKAGSCAVTLRSGEDITTTFLVKEGGALCYTSDRYWRPCE